MMTMVHSRTLEGMRTISLLHPVLEKYLCDKARGGSSGCFNLLSLAYYWIPRFMLREYRDLVNSFLRDGVAEVRREWNRITERFLAEYLAAIRSFDADSGRGLAEYIVERLEDQKDIRDLRERIQPVINARCVDYLRSWRILQTVSLNAPVGSDGDGELGDFISCDGTFPSPEDAAVADEQRKIIQGLVDLLQKEKQKKVFREIISDDDHKIPTGEGVETFREIARYLMNEDLVRRGDFF